MKADYCVFIGRFQPLTIAHEAMICRAKEEAENVIIILGSDRASPSLKNPFTTDERKKMILSAFPDVVILTVKDSAYNFNAWIAEVHKKVSAITTPNSKIKMIGHFKDDSSYYLKYFPQWEFVNEKSIYNLSATDVRNELFNGRGHISTKWTTFVSVSVEKFINEWIEKEKVKFDNFVAEYDFLKKYHKSWESAPYPPTFVTTDALVLSHGHILLIKRGRNPGKGLYALPGGFLDQVETIEQGCIRELKEETKIDVASPILKSSITQVHVFDHPHRDPRGRTITHAHLIELSLREMPNVKAADDAAEVVWIPIGELDNIEDQFFGDHIQIIKFLLGRSM